MDVIHTQKLSKVERKEMIKNDIKENIVPAIGLSTLSVALVSVGKEGVKSDSFMTTAKNCVKSCAIDSKASLKEFFECIKLGKLNKYVDKIGNKTFFAGLFAASTMAWVLALAGMKSLYFNKKNKE